MQLTRSQVVLAILAGAALLALSQFWEPGFLAIVGLWLTAYGSLSLVRGQIAVGGRGGPARTYTGLVAYAWSIAFIVSGVLGLWLAASVRTWPPH